MKREEIMTVLSNQPLTPTVYEMKLAGKMDWVERPGQFVNLALEGLYLRRPISICDWTSDTLTLVYKVVGEGTAKMATFSPQAKVNLLVGLGNGFPTPKENSLILVGGGVGIPPLYGLAKTLVQQGKEVQAYFGFNNAEEVFYQDQFAALGVKPFLATLDGSAGEKGTVIDLLRTHQAMDIPYLACGPLGMLKAVYQASSAHGWLSFEERMGCGFGACMGCSCKTITGYKRICTEGPVLESEELLWTKD